MIPSIPQLRAVLIAVALIVHGLYAFPWPQTVKRSELNKPGVQEELDAWYGLIESVGIPVPRDQFVEYVVSSSKPLRQVENFFKRPFRPWMRVTGTGQGWALFAGADTYPHRFEVEGRVMGGSWELLYRRVDPEHALFDDRIRYRRMRGVYDGSSNKAGHAYRNLCKIVARWMFDARPDLYQVRVKMIRHHTTIPGEPKDPERRTRNTRIFKRQDVEL